MAYIGVTGFTKRIQVLEALSVYPDYYGRRYQLMVGVLASWRSLRSLPLKPRWQQRTPPNSKLGQIFLADPRIENLIHYSASPEHADDLFEDLIALHNLAGPHINGFQLNIAWPSPKALGSYLQRYSTETKFVLQLGAHALRRAHDSPEAVAIWLRDYDGLIDAVLIDPSGGRGLPFDPHIALQYLVAISLRNPDLDLGLAGGLGPDSLNHLKPILKHFDDLSIDAEGRLRDENNDLDLSRVKQYLIGAQQLLR